MAEPASFTTAGRLQTTDQNIERRRAYVGLEADDLSRIAATKEVVHGGLDRFAETFFAFLGGIPEAAPLFANRPVLEELRRLKREHLKAMVEGVYDAAYVDQRIRLGRLYSQVGLDVRVFLGAFHHLMRTIGSEIMARPGSSPEAAFAAFMSLKKIAFLDIGIIVDTLIDAREALIFSQQEAIRELSTPVIQLRDRLLILPIIGLIDSQRAMQLTDSLLHAIRANRAKMVVMDITGVAAVDSKVANHLIQTVAAARLMGATVTITGLSAEVAQALVALGVDLSRITTFADLQGGLEDAERQLGYHVVPLPDAARL